MKKSHNLIRHLKLFKTMLVLGLVGLLTGCEGDDPQKPKSQNQEVVICLPHSISNAVTNLGITFQQQHPTIHLTYHIEDAIIMQRQIEDGANCDIFITDNKLQMDQLDIDASSKNNPKRNDFIVPFTHADLVANNIVLAASPYYNGNIKTMFELSQALKNNEDVTLAYSDTSHPLGQYSSKIASFFDHNEQQLIANKKLIITHDLFEVEKLLKEGKVQLGLIYETNAIKDKLRILDRATPAMCGQVVYSVARIKNQNQDKLEIDGDKEFYHYLKSPQALEVFKRYGFKQIVDNRK